MIELIAAAVSGAVVGGGAGWFYWRALSLRWTEIASECMDLNQATITTLTALRSNCFITNKKGHRVRYSQASVERRVKAETPKEVV